MKIYNKSRAVETASGMTAGASRPKNPTYHGGV